MKEASLNAHSSLQIIPSCFRNSSEKNRRPRRRSHLGALVRPGALLRKCPRLFGALLFIAIILLSGFVSPVQAQSLTRSLQKIYWSFNQDGVGTIFRSDPDGTNLQTMFTSEEVFNGIAVDAEGNRVYWGSWGKLYSMRLNGSDVRAEVYQGGMIVDVDIAGTWVYWTNYDMGTISRLNKYSGNVEILVEGAAGKREFVSDPEHPHLASSASSGSTVASKGGASLDRPWGIAIKDYSSEKKIFWTEEGGNRVMKSDLDGRNTTVFHETGLNYPRGIEFDSGRIFFTNATGDSLVTKQENAALDVAPDFIWSCFVDCTDLSVSVHLLDVEIDDSFTGNDDIFYLTDNQLDRIWKVTRTRTTVTHEILFERPAPGRDGPVGIGLLIDDGSWATPELTVSLTGPDRIIPGISGELTPNPFVMTAVIDNVGGSTVTNVSTTLSPKGVLHIEGPESRVQAIGDMLPGEQVTVVWHIGISSSTSDKTVNVGVSVTSGNATLVGVAHYVDVFASGLLATNLTEKIYWLEAVPEFSSRRRIMRSEPDGSAVEEVLNLDIIPNSLTVDHGYAYFMDNGKIYRSKLNGREVETLYVDTGVSVMWGAAELKTCGGDLYWGNTRGIWRSRLSSAGASEPEMLIQAPESSSPHSFSLTSDCSQVYWGFSGSAGWGIRRADIDGSNEESILDGVTSDVEIDDNNLFYVYTGHIFRANLDGTDPTPIDPAVGVNITFVGHAEKIELDTVAEQIYFRQNTTTGTYGSLGIWRVDYDGSNQTELVSARDFDPHRHALALKPAITGGGAVASIDIVSPAELGRNSAGELMPNPFMIRAHIDPGFGSISDARVTLDLPSGLSLVSGEETVSIGRLRSGEPVDVSWEVRASSNAIHPKHKYRVHVNGSNAVGGSASATTFAALDYRPWFRAVNKIYWTEYGTGELHRMDPDGSNDEVIWTGSDPSMLGVDVNSIYTYVNPVEIPKKVYWGTPDGILSSRLNGTGVDTLSITYARKLLVDVPSGKAYYRKFSFSGNTIKRINLDGTGGPEELHSTTAVAFTLDRSDQKIYWACQQDICRMDLDGSNNEVLLEMVSARSIALDRSANNLYYITTVSYPFYVEIYRASMDGGPRTLIFRQLCDGSCTTEDFTLLLDENTKQLYWNDVGEDKIFRVDIHGQGETVIIDRSGVPQTSDFSEGPKEIAFLKGSFNAGIPASQSSSRLTINVIAPSELTRGADTLLTPNPYSVAVALENIGDSTLTNLTVALALGSGQVIAGAADSLQTRASFVVGARDTLRWQVEVTDTVIGRLTYDVIVDADQIDPSRTERSITIPSRPLPPPPALGSIYWIEQADFDGTSGVIWRGNPDGTNKQKIVVRDPDGNVLPDLARFGLAIDSNEERIYWADRQYHGGDPESTMDVFVYSAALDGSDARAMFDDTRCTSDLPFETEGHGEPPQYCRISNVSVSASNIYWTFEWNYVHPDPMWWFRAEIWRQNRSGGDPEVVLGAFPYWGTSTAVLEGTGVPVYTIRDESVIYRAGSSTTSDHADLTPLLGAGDVARPRGIQLDEEAGKMYFIDELSGPAINRANLDGSDLETLYSCSFNECRPTDLTLDLEAGHVFWTDDKLDQILRVDLDGSNQTMIARLEKSPDFAGPSAIALFHGTVPDDPIDPTPDLTGAMRYSSEDDDFRSDEAAIAYNPTDDEYLIVWDGRDPVSGEDDIFGRRVSGQTGEKLGELFRISNQGEEGDTDIQVSKPAVAFNSGRGEFLVVWEGERTDGEWEIYGQRIRGAYLPNAEDEIGEDFRISFTGPDDDPYWDAGNVAIAYNGDRYLVVWDLDLNISNDDADYDREIYGVRLDGQGEAQELPFQISNFASSSFPLRRASHPAVAANEETGEFLVVWEWVTLLYGQRIRGVRDPVEGDKIGAEDFLILEENFVQGNVTDDPAVAWQVSLADPNASEYLVVWTGITELGAESEIFGQRIRGSYDGNLSDHVGQGVFRISDMGPTGTDLYGAAEASVAFDLNRQEYLVVWEGDDSTFDEFDIYGQWLDVEGEDIGDDFRISSMGPSDNRDYAGRRPALASNSTHFSNVGNNEFLVVWHGNESLDQERAVYGRFISRTDDSRSSQVTNVDTSGTPETELVDEAGVDVAGTVTGINNQGDTAKSTALVPPPSKSGSLYLSEVSVWFSYKSADVTDQTYSLKVFQGDLTGGPSGDPIFSRTYSMADIPADDDLSTVDDPRVHAIDPLVSIDGPFFVSIDFGNYTFERSSIVSIGSSERVGQRVDEVWQKNSDGIWENLSDAWFGGTEGVQLWITAELIDATGIDIETVQEELPSGVMLSQNYPNPFNPTTTIQYAVPHPGEVRLTVYDLLGRRVAVLADGYRMAGSYAVRFDAGNLSSGMYFYQLEAGDLVESRKMLLVR